MRRKLENTSSPASEPSLEQENRPTLDRRTFLKGGLAASSLLVSRGISGATGTTALTNDCGVASGEPKADSVVIWTRIPDEYLPSSGSLSVTWEVATDESFSSLVKSGSFSTSSSVDWTVTVQVSGLASYTRYFYRFRTAGGFVSVTGRTQTAPGETDANEAIRFAFVSCQQYADGYYNVLIALAQENFDFCVCLGDNIYEGSKTDVRSDTKTASSLSDYRNKYKLYLSDPNLREVRRLYPWLVIWDDHEVYNNFNGSDATSDQRTRQQNGYQAFREYMPIDPAIVLTTVDGIPAMKVYRKLSYGSLADFFLLDERQYRDGEVCVGEEEPTYGCDELYAEDRTMLGVDQAEWFKDALLSSNARWKFVLNEVMMMAFKLTNSVMPLYKSLRPNTIQAREETYEGLLISLDQWDGYPEERKQLLTFIQDYNIQNVVVLTGDIHNCYAGVLRPDFTHGSSPAVAVEIVGGSVTSDGIAEHTDNKDHSDFIYRVLKHPNPHLEYLDAYHHVYTRVEVSPDATVATYVAVDTVRSEGFEFFDLMRLTVPEGTPELLVEAPSLQKRRPGGRSRR